MVVTSNRSPRDWYALFPNPVLAESALDRLVHSAHHVTLRGRTYRPLRRPDGGGMVNLENDEEHNRPDDDRDPGTHAAETAQEPRNELCMTPSTSTPNLPGERSPARRTRG
jgi:hypothetical protein